MATHFRGAEACALLVAIGALAFLAAAAWFALFVEQARDRVEIEVITARRGAGARGVGAGAGASSGFLGALRVVRRYFLVRHFDRQRAHVRTPAPIVDDLDRHH